jgi:hypothetical protein
MISLDKRESERVEKGECQGCAACKSKKTYKWGTSGNMGSTDYLYVCGECGTVRVWL